MNIQANGTNVYRHTFIKQRWSKPGTLWRISKKITVEITGLSNSVPQKGLCHRHSNPYFSCGRRKHILDFYKSFCDCMKDVTPYQMLLHALNICRVSCLLQISSVTYIYEPLLKEMEKLSAPYINTGNIWPLMAYCFFTKVRLYHKSNIAITSVVELLKSHFLAATEFKISYAVLWCMIFFPHAQRGHTCR